MKFLVLDDEPLPLKLAAAMVARAGHEAKTSSNWSEVGPMLFEENIDVVLADVQMPGLSGDRLVDAIRQTRAGQEVHIVLLSSLPEEELADRARSCGADGWRRKPITTDIIREIVADIERARAGGVPVDR